MFALDPANAKDSILSVFAWTERTLVAHIEKMPSFNGLIICFEAETQWMPDQVLLGVTFRADSAGEETCFLKAVQVLKEYGFKVTQERLPIRNDPNNPFGVDIYCLVSAPRFVPYDRPRQR